jgi:hypothetical protein
LFKNIADTKVFGDFFSKIPVGGLKLKKISVGGLKLKKIPVGGF